MSTATDTLSFFRIQWADRFTDSCIIKRVTGETFNDTTGQTGPTYTENYSGECLVRPAGPSDAVFGEEQVAVRGYIVFLPHTELDPLPGDLVDITSTTDGFLTGKQFAVTNVSGDTYSTRRALICEEVASG